jgi:hypothetical protein
MEERMKLKRLFFISAGCLSLILGAVGIVLPIIPTFPFFMLTALCFAKSSQKLHDWFVGTKMYKKHIASLLNSKSMTLKGKTTVILSVSILFAAGFLMMRHVIYGRIIILTVWLFHLIYFIFYVKTIKKS